MPCISLVMQQYLTTKPERDVIPFVIINNQEQQLKSKAVILSTLQLARQVFIGELTAVT